MRWLAWSLQEHQSVGFRYAKMAKRLCWAVGNWCLTPGCAAFSFSLVALMWKLLLGGWQWWVTAAEGYWGAGWVFAGSRGHLWEQFSHPTSQLWSSSRVLWNTSMAHRHIPATGSNHSLFLLLQGLKTDESKWCFPGRNGSIKAYPSWCEQALAEDGLSVVFRWCRFLPLVDWRSKFNTIFSTEAPWKFDVSQIKPSEKPIPGAW